MRILTLDSALARCSAALVTDGTVLAHRVHDAARGHAALLPVIVRDILAEAGAPSFDLVAVTVGPGSFTGIRAGLALAQGLALASDMPIVAVTVGEALAFGLQPPTGRALWIATDSRRGRVFLERDGAVAAFDLTALPRPSGPVALAGDAGHIVAAWLAAKDIDVMLTNARLPGPEGIAAAAEARRLGALPALAAQPLYIDPPEAKPPAGGLRPPPQA